MKDLLKFRSILVLFVLSSILIIGSCKKEEKIIEGDKTGLNELIASADHLSASVTSADYPQSAIDSFKTVLLKIKNDATLVLTQPQIDKLITDLSTARKMLEYYDPLRTLISEADIISNYALPSVYPQYAIDNFNDVLVDVKTSGNSLLTQQQIEELITRLTEAMNNLSVSGTNDYVKLYTMITYGEGLSNSASSESYPQLSIDNFKTTLQSMKIASAELLTDLQINNMITELTEATQYFEKQQYSTIDESIHLNAGWHFDEGTGTIATAFSTIKHVADFKPGNAVLFGTDSKSPSWVEGVNGGSAVYLDKGAHLEVPYSTSFLPADLTISVWVKPDELRESNYILSQNYWTGYKLQTQGNAKPFFTFMKTDGGIVDADNETDNSIIINQWNQIVVVLNSTSKELKFYINGTHTKTWTENTKGIGPLIQTLTNPDPQPLIIGGMATDTEISASFMDWITVDNIGYFKGVIDELKIYNICLSNGQVTQQYNFEKP